MTSTQKDKRLTGINSRILRDHQALMSDPMRMDAYRRAMGKTCVGRVVCEIGVGLGPLSLMALDAGAKKVYGIEVVEDVLKLAERVIRTNGYGRTRFVAIHGLSLDVELPERVDVVLSETLDSAVFGENAAVFMLDARKRFLKPEGLFIPREIQCFTALASPGVFTDQCSFWNNETDLYYGFDYTEVGFELRRHRQTLSSESEELFSDWTPWTAVKFRKPETFPKRPKVSLRVTQPGLIQGICTSFKAILAMDVELNTSPREPETTWQQGFLPFEEPIACDAGDTLSVNIKIERGAELRALLDAWALRVAWGRHIGGDNTPPGGSP